MYKNFFTSQNGSPQYAPILSFFALFEKLQMALENLF